MLLSCPHCGHDLDEPLKDGFGTCGHCSRAYDTSPYNKILGTAWYVRRHNCADIDQLLHLGVKEPEALISVALAWDGDYTHEELIKALNQLGISKDYVLE